MITFESDDIYYQKQQNVFEQIIYFSFFFLFFPFSRFLLIVDMCFVFVSHTHTPHTPVGNFLSFLSTFPSTHLLFRWTMNWQQSFSLNESNKFLDTAERVDSADAEWRKFKYKYTILCRWSICVCQRLSYRLLLYSDTGQIRNSLIIFRVCVCHGIWSELFNSLVCRRLDEFWISDGFVGCLFASVDCQVLHGWRDLLPEITMMTVSWKLSKMEA